MRFLYLLVSIPLLAFASTQKITWKAQSFRIEIPQDWKVVHELYGIPLTLLGPVKNNETRTVLQIIPTGQKSSALKPEDAKAFSEKYAEGRKNWVKSQQGLLIDLLPGKIGQTTEGISFLEAGVSYQLHQKSFAERTYYLQCPKQIVHLKVVLNVGLVELMPQMQSIVRSFQCDG